MFALRAILKHKRQHRHQKIVSACADKAFFFMESKPGIY